MSTETAIQIALIVTVVANILNIVLILKRGWFG